jgi:hypothetical protein
LLAVVEDGMRHLVIVIGALTVLLAAGSATDVLSTTVARFPAEGGPCSAQPPGCGSAQATAENLAGFTWSAAPVPPLSPRFAEASVWTGTELLIWGGAEWNQGMADAADGAAYDPVTRAWTPMPASPLSPRNTPFAVWTGTRALFWGGGNGYAVLNDGASYDPASRTWAMLPAAPLPPDADGGQLIVWTGRQMVVIQRGSAAAFDPAASSWVPVPTLPGVAGWAEWTGSEVIAWVVSQSPPSTRVLGAYSWVPGSVAWTSVPFQPDDDGAVPFGTSAAIGGRLLFLGGDSCWVVGCPAQSFFDGAWFDASSGTWTYLPEKFSGGLGPAVWTGSAMVVFATKAGASTRPLYGPADIPAGAAAAFDPSTGSWTNLAPCPIPDLTNASLAWTGRQLIVVTMNDESGDTPQLEVLSRPIRHSK